MTLMMFCRLAGISSVVISKKKSAASELVSVKFSISSE